MSAGKPFPMTGGLPLPFADFLGNLRQFVYLPQTDWSRMWEEFYSPRFYFGCNVKDADTEREVLDEVGSYGRQLNVLLDAMVVFVQHLQKDDLDEEQRKRLRALVDLMESADKASARVQGKSPQMLALLLADWLHARSPQGAAKPAPAGGGSATPT
jgi:hypothetical protein